MLKKQRLGRVICTYAFFFLAGLFGVAHAEVSPVSPVASALPQQIANPHAPDYSKSKILADLVKNGAKLFYLGGDAGLDGWFILKDRQLQIAYITKNGQGTLIGALYNDNGQNITVQQIRSLAGTNKEFADAINPKPQTSESVPPSPSAGVPMAPLPGTAKSVETTKTPAN